MSEGGAWEGYVGAYHDAHPGITEDVLAPARDDQGRDPYDWLLDAVPDAGLVVDLACGNGPVVGRLAGRAVGVDRSRGELARARRDAGPLPLVRADVSRLPVAGGTAAAVTASMCLMVVTPLPPVLAEVARVLEPGGVLAATVPSRSGRGASGFAEILAELGQTGVAYPTSLDDAADQLSAAGLVLVGEDEGAFVRPVASAQDAELVVRSFYAPGAGPDRRRAAAARLRARVATGPVTVTYPVRRLVAVRG